MYALNGVFTGGKLYAISACAPIYDFGLKLRVFCWETVFISTKRGYLPPSGVICISGNAYNGAILYFHENVFCAKIGEESIRQILNYI